MRRNPWLALAALSFLVAGARPTRADEPPVPPTPVPAAPDDGKSGPSDDKPVAKSTESGLELRMYHVSALTSGRPWFSLERGPYPASAETVNDASNPLFGSESEETVQPLGSIDDLIEFIKVGTAQGDFSVWAVDGTSIAAMGTRTIVMRADRSLHERVRSLVADYERRVLVSVTVDVVALRGEASAAKDGGLVGAVARGALVPLSAARSCGFPMSAIVGRTGADEAYVQEQRAEVAQKSNASDPQVGIAKRGLAFGATIQQATADRVVLQLGAWWAHPDAPTRRDVEPTSDPVESITVDGRQADALLDLVPGTWSLLPSGGDVVFAVRATVAPFGADAAVPDATFLSAPDAQDPAPSGPMSVHAYNVGDLSTRLINTRGVPPALSPSKYSPKWPPELNEPPQEFPTDALIDWIKVSTTPAYWSTEGVSLDVKNQTIYANVDELHAKLIADALAGLRAWVGKTTRLRGTIVTLPLTSLPEYFAGLGDGSTLLADGGKSLLARAGARAIDRSGVLCRPGQRVASVGGTTHSYVGDYDVEIAEDAFIGRPITRSVLAGLSLDVECRLAAGGAFASVDLRIDRSTWNSTRQVPTTHGNLECPTLGISRIRGGTVIPIGSQRIVGATLDGGVVTLTILSATAD